MVSNEPPSNLLDSIVDWTVPSVVYWLSNTIGLPQYAESFEENEISGDVLVHLDHETLMDLGIDSVGHRLTILKAIYTLKIDNDVRIEDEHWVPRGL
jgi:hypothetical protein